MFPSPRFVKPALWLAIVLATSQISVSSRGQASLRGFFPAEAARQAEWEKTFRAMPTPGQARQDIRILTQTPHVAGTPEDYKTAQYVLEQMRAAGLEAKIEEYQVLLPMPKEVRIDLVEPIKRDGPTPESGAPV